METTLSITEARKGLSKLVDRVRRQGASAVITRSGTPVARVVPLTPTVLTGRELAVLWRERPRLDPADSEALEREIRETWTKLNLPPVPKWH